MLSTEQILIRLVLSIVLSGLIGIERESIRRPAGFRTHILVCVGSTLVMLVSIYIFNQYNGETTLQPDRLGAQVISGIGFLGAGTIIKEGNTVKGLTTAASLWAVACIGLAIGSGFYLGGILTTFLVLITLAVFNKAERDLKTRQNYMTVKITTFNKPGQLGKIGEIIGSFKGSIVSIDLEENDDDELISIELLIKMEDKTKKLDIINKLQRQEDIIKVSKLK
ncbi:MgtC/SapB family protein [Dethiothermospora halolimnae]|uniref:MgtC/SapB family protein n=1 Tax=Dethiothermospora halolimnae TaxID=3114390 RepID=UPI003CCC0198